MADKIFYNGVVYPMDDKCPRMVTAVAVKGNRIEAVGSDRDMLLLAQAGCEKIDLEGRCVLPGFNDTHCHVVLTGIEYEKISLRGAKSVEECVDRCRNYIEKNHVKEGTWIYGSGYDQNRFEGEQRNPVREDLDRISRVHPIIMERVCGHIATVNDLAYHLAGYDENTHISGGVIDRDDQGRRTGIIREAALDTFKRNMPKRGAEEIRRAADRVFREAASFGVTSMQTDDLEAAPFDVIKEAYDELAAEGKATVRIWEEVQAARVPVLNEFLTKGMRTGDGTPFFKVGNIKLLTDGSLGARTACLREDYSDDPGNAGVAVYSQAELNEVVMAAHRAGMQVAAHAIGDGAAAQCVEAMTLAYRSDMKDLRNRIVHCQFVDEGILQSMKEGHICADVQPPFVPSDRPLVDSRMGRRAEGGYVWKSMMNHGIVIGGGSDSPVETFDPIWGIHCAVNRTDEAGYPEGGWHPSEKLTIGEAVSIYTRSGAYFSFEEDTKGSLRPGKLADMAILDRDIMNVPEEEILTVHNVMTVSDGRIVYQS